MHVAIFDSPAFHLWSAFTNVHNHDERDLVIRRQMATASFMLSPGPASPGGLVEIWMGSPVLDVPDETPDEGTVRKLICAVFLQLVFYGYPLDILP
jgi:hypothetical protein